MADSIVQYKPVPLRCSFLVVAVMRGRIKVVAMKLEAAKGCQTRAPRDSWSQLHEEADLRTWQESQPVANQSHADAAGIDPFNTTSMTASILLEGRMTPIIVKTTLKLDVDRTCKLLCAETVRTLARETDVQFQDHEAHDAWKYDTSWLYAAEWLLVRAVDSGSHRWLGFT